MSDKITDTSLEPDDLDPFLDPEGIGPLETPLDAGLADDTDDDAAFQALLDDLSPGEAQRVVDTMRPLDDEEAEIVEDMPEIDDLKKVDGSEQDAWIRNIASRGYQGMDAVLEDSVYGDAHMNKEETLERQGSDDESGFGIPGLSSIKKLAKKVGRGAYKYGRRGLTTPFKGARKAARWTGRKAGSLAKHFVPNRDAAKAKMVKNLYTKLTVEHANWLAQQDKNAGRPVQPIAQYRAASKPWAKQQIARGGLPTNVRMGRDEILAHDMMGSDVVGAWWNPLSWFQQKVQVVVQQAQPELSAVGPDGMPTDQSTMDPSMMDPSMNQSYPQDYGMQDYGTQDYGMQDYGDYGAQDYYPQDDYAYGDLSGISGEDSLGAFATEILSGQSKTTPKKKLGRAPSPAKTPPTKEDQLVETAVVKLRSLRPLGPGEVAVLAKLAKQGHPRAKRVFAALSKEGTTKLSGDSTSGAWLHKLNPFYWIFNSSDERKYIDVQKEKWNENADRRKELAKREDVLKEALKAKRASEAVEQAKAQAAATEAQLAAIQESIKKNMMSGATSRSSGDDVGHEKPTVITDVVVEAVKQGGQDPKVVRSLYEKIVAGKPLSAAEIVQAKKTADILQRLRVVHGDIYRTRGASAVHGACVGAVLSSQIDQAKEKNARNARAAVVLQKKINGVGPDSPITPEQKKAIQALAASTVRMQDVARSHASGRAYQGLDDSSKLRVSAMVGASRAAMSPSEKKMIAAIAALAKAGNPRAAESLKRLRASGAVMGGDHVEVGFSISDAFKYATAPVWLPTKYAYKGIKSAAKWTGRQLGITSRSRSPEEVRLAKIRAAAKRRAAARARAAAADAQTQAELRAQEMIAQAADAEADAADAEALSKEAAMRTSEVEADPELANREDDEDSSGSFVGSWEAFVGAEHKKHVAVAASKGPAGAKVRAGAKLYARAKKGDEKAVAAIQTMVAKAKKGDKQAAADVRAVQAGRRAVIAKQKAQKKHARVLARKARKLKVIAAQRKIEAKLAAKLVRTERRHTLNKLSKVERRAARGDKRAKKYIKKQIELAKKGDRRATVRVGMIKLVHKVNKAAPTKAERRRVAQAGRLYARAKAGNPKAVRDIKLIEAAAKKGNPNAKRAVARIKVAKEMQAAVAVGVVVGTTAKKKEVAAAQKREAVWAAQAKQATGTASREELAAGARAAASLGDKETAGKLAVAATRAPSATEMLKKTATVVAAKEEGNPEAKKAVDSAFEQAKKGDPEGIKKTAKVVAVQAIDDVDKGRPLSPAMQDAVNLQERIAAHDPAAIEEGKLIARAATSESPSAEATYAAVTLSAAAMTAKALASKPKARQEFLSKVNPMSESERGEGEKRLADYVARTQAGTIAPEEALVAEKLAEKLGKPKVAAEIAAQAPPLDEAPLTSLPDLPQAPITGPWSLVKESLRALTFSTRDPLANWREGVASLGRKAAPVATTSGEDVPVSDSGWSPFGFFRSLLRNAPVIAPAAALIASAASLATAVETKKQMSKQSKSVQAPVASPAPTPAQAAAPKKQSRDESSKQAETVSGSEKSYRDYVVAALQSKQITKRDLARALDAQTGPSASSQTKAVVGKKTIDFLQERGVKIV